MKRQTPKTNTAAALHTSLTVALVVLAALVPAVARAATDDLRLLRIDLGAAYWYTDSQSINDHAQITIVARPTDTWDNHLILWSEDVSMVNLGVMTGLFYVNSINNSGQVAYVDSSYSGTGGTKLWTPETSNGTTGITRLISTDYITVFGVNHILNNNGQVLTRIAPDSEQPSNTVPALWTPGGSANAGTTRTLEGLRYAYALNDSGMVVGRDPNGQAAIWTETEGEVTAINVEGSDSSEAVAVNNNGQVLVRAFVDDSDKSWVWTAGSELLLDLGNLGGSTDTYAYDINDAGQVVGASDGADYTTGTPSGDTWTDSLRAFLWTAEGGMKDLNTLFADKLLSWAQLEGGTNTSGWYMLAGATGINAHGEIIGYGYYWDGEQMFSGQPFALLLPVAVPEPGTWATLAGLALLAWVVARRYHDARA
jgi:hypothetical protein